MRVNNLFLEADNALDNNEIEKAYELFTEILNEDPKHGQSHCYLGWIYKNRFSNSEKAEYHYKLAIQFLPQFGQSYINYIFLLRDQNRLEELENMLLKASEIPQVSKITLNDEYGTLYELLGDYKKAIEYYRKAIALTLNNDTDDLKAHIKRCQEKHNLFSSNRLSKAFRILLGKD
jgi:Tfp pilus assembly protein PilF